MAKSKAKWLVGATTRELVVLLKGCIKDEDLKKANKIITELLDRIPEDDGNMTIEEAVEKAKQDLEAILDLYNQEAKSVAEVEDDDEDEEEEEAPKPKRARKSRKSKAKPEPEEDEDEDEDEPEDEDDEDEDDEDEDEEDDPGYEDMSQGELKKELRRRGIKVTKSMKKADMVRALEADDAV